MESHPMSRLRSSRTTYNRLPDSEEPPTEYTGQTLPNGNDTQPTPRTDTDKYLTWAGIFWFVFTVIISVLIIVTVRIYQTAGTISAGQKHAFNTFTTFLILVLGLNFFVSSLCSPFNSMARLTIGAASQEAFKALAKASAPKIITLQSWKQDERDLIEDLDSLTSVVRLGWRVGLKYGTIWFCLAWVRMTSFPHCLSVLVIAFQLVIAALTSTSFSSQQNFTDVDYR